MIASYASDTMAGGEIDHQPATRELPLEHAFIALPFAEQKFSHLILILGFSSS